MSKASDISKSNSIKKWALKWLCAQQYKSHPKCRLVYYYVSGSSLLYYSFGGTKSVKVNLYLFTYSFQNLLRLKDRKLLKYNSIIVLKHLTRALCNMYIVECELVASFFLLSFILSRCEMAFLYISGPPNQKSPVWRSWTDYVLLSGCFFISTYYGIYIFTSNILLLLVLLLPRYVFYYYKITNSKMLYWKIGN